MERSILLVDDVRLFLEIQKEFLKNSSVQVLTAKNGVDALQVISARLPDLIIMDLEMPEMDGADCCRVIKSNPASAGIPVVMVTARGDLASELHCRSAGANEFLTKPLNRSLFLETASRYVKEVERREERKPVDLPGTVHCRGTSFPCAVRNISVGGALICADFPGEVDRLIRICFVLPDGAPVECQGKIVWCKGASAGGQSEFGVSFTLPSTGTKDALIGFLEVKKHR